MDYTDHIYVGNDIGVFASTDAGNSWFDFNEGLPDAVIVMDLSISPVNRKIRAATHGNGVYERAMIEKSVYTEPDGDIIAGYKLEQNYPNPFNPSTKISFTVGHSSLVTMKIYDLLGKEVAVLLNEEKQPGTYNIEFTAGSFGDAAGLASGIYYYRIEAKLLNKLDRQIVKKNHFIETKKMIYLK
jgi:hypothetical protein